MSADFRARQLRVSQIINSGSASTTPLLIYGLGSATDDSGGFNATHFATGSDTWLFISGTSGSKNSTSRGVVAFKGDVVISGTIYNSAGTAYSTGGGSPGGSDTQVQFNDGGSAFGGDSGLTFNKITNDLTVAGDLAVNGGDLTTTQTTFNLVNATATTLNIGGASTNTTIGSSTGKVIIPGDLQVQGITTTVSSSNVTIRDSIIGLGYLSGTVAESSTGDRGFIGGFTGANSNVAFIWSNNSSSFIAGKTGNLPNSSSIFVSNLQPIRASSFQVNGTTAVVTSSDGSTLTLSGAAVVVGANSSNVITFKENNLEYLQFSTQAGYSSQIRATEAAYPALYMSGSSVNMDSYSGVTWFNKNSDGSLLVDNTTLISPKIYARRGDGLAYDLTLSGADLFLGSNNGRVSTYRGTTEYLRSSYNGASDVVFSAQAFNFSVGSTASTQISGSSVTLNHGAGVINLQRHGTQFLTISSGSGDVASIVASAGKQLQVGGTGLTKLSGSLLAITAGATGIGFEVSNTNFLTVLAQSANTVLSSSNQLILRPTSGVTQVTGSLIAPNITGSLRKTTGNLDFITGSGVTVNYNSSGQWELTASATPGGSNKQVQFNDGGSLGGDAEFTYDKTANLLNLTGSITHGDRNTSSGNYSHSQGEVTTASGNYSHAEGSQTTASGGSSHAEGYLSTASGTWSHAEGGHTTAGPGNASHAEGWYSVASGGASHAEGQFATASGGYAHAEGNTTTASGQDSHAEGYMTTASGTASHAEGNTTTASGNYSHAGGQYTEAAGAGQTVFGKYNVQSNTTSLFVIGDGSSSVRHDILRVNSGSVEVTGSFVSTLGISGSLTKLSDGTSYLIAGSNVTITSASNGAVTISAASGGGGGGSSYFTDPVSGKLNTTGSLALAGNLGDTYTTANAGTDTHFFVSGSKGTVASRSTSGLSVFGGDIITSGSITLDNGSGHGILHMTAGGELSLRNRYQGGYFVGSVFTSLGSAVNFMEVRPNGYATGSVASVFPGLYAGPANPFNSHDTTFFVSGKRGAKDGITRGASVFGGDVVASGSLYIGTNTTDSLVVNSLLASDIIPDGNRTRNLGSESARFANIYTGDLHLRNERGDWTIVEEPDYLSVINNRTGVKYKMMLERIQD